MANQRPFLEPTLPFKGHIKGALYEGKTITVAGRVMPGAMRFHVNLVCGTNLGADIALHFNPRYENNQDVVVCNTLQHSQWGTEERKRPVPMARGTVFNLMFLVNRDSFSVVVNGAHFVEYMHRLPVSRVNVIAVDGGVEVHSISFQNPAFDRPHALGKFQQSMLSPSQWCNAAQAQPTACFNAGFPPAPPPYSPQPSFTVPYKNIVAGGLYPGRNITLQGLVNHNADKFCVNLRFNAGIALHFNPRFNEMAVVRNSHLKEKWGPEERSGGMPFQRGQPFMVTISCDTQCYKIFVNGVQMFSYNHRHFILQEVDILEVSGDLSLSSVVF